MRATSKATVQETNCHPFRYSRWLFVHNGEIEEIERFRRDLLFQVAPQFFPHIQGTTDSELMFYLALTLGLEDDPIGGLERMAGLVEKVAGTQGVAQALWMTLGLSDGQRMYAVRYASDSDAPTLYHTADTEHLYRLNKTLRTQSPQPIRLIVSEPIGNVAEAWQEIPQNTAVSFIDGQVRAATVSPDATAAHNASRLYVCAGQAIARPRSGAACSVLSEATRRSRISSWRDNRSWVSNRLETASR